MKADSQRSAFYIEHMEKKQTGERDITDMIPPQIITSQQGAVI